MCPCMSLCVAHRCTHAGGSKALASGILAATIQPQLSRESPLHLDLEETGNEELLAFILLFLMLLGTEPC